MQRTALLTRLVDGERVERRRGQHVPGAHVELGAVARADDDVLVQLAIRERALLVRAGVVEGDPAAGRPAHTDGPPFDLDPPERACGRVSGGADLVPDGLCHRGIWSSGRGLKSTVSSSGATPRCSAACAAAAATLRGRIDHENDEPDGHHDDDADRPVERLPVHVVPVVRLRLERAEIPEHRCRHRHRHDRVLPQLAARLPHEPERRHGEDEVDELDRERPDGGRPDERREPVAGRAGTRLPDSSGTEKSWAPKSSSHEIAIRPSRRRRPRGSPTHGVPCARRPREEPRAADRRGRARRSRGRWSRRSRARAPSHRGSRRDRGSSRTTSRCNCVAIVVHGGRVARPGALLATASLP